MRPLITLDNVSLAFGLDHLLDQVKLQINEGERVCLIGRNGAGKSSLLKIVEGTMLPDSGNVIRQPNLRIARLAQELPQESRGTIYEFVASGLADTGALLAAYHALTQRLAHDHTDRDLIELERLQQRLDSSNAWNYEQQINTVLSQLSLPADKEVSDLSGGWQRRVALAKALVASPDLLLLDEPTNHLDIETIQWLEDRLLNLNIGLLFITHDRALLQRLATRIIELDRGQLTSWPGDYDNFLRRKEELLHAEMQQNALFDKKLAQEEIWIRQGIKARRTRNEGRVRALKALRVERSKRREVWGKASFNLNEAMKSGQLVVEASKLTHAFQNHSVIDQFSIRIMRGDRIGLIGPNGIGKSTLLNILLGNLTPQGGTVTQGTKLQIGYFDQLRSSLDLNKTVFDNIATGKDEIEIDGKKRHIISYLGDFLFTPQRALTPVKALSGGECNRLVLAKLFSQPTNLLVLDEPTNDLDIETLELLEELLTQYQGTLLIVSHDRRFLDNLVTSTLVFSGNGKITEYVGGYQDYVKHLETVKPTNQNPSDTKKNPSSPKSITASKKMSFKDQQELASLPQKIETLENEQQTLQDLVASRDFYQRTPEEIAITMARLKSIEIDLDTAYQRWEALEKMSGVARDH